MNKHAKFFKLCLNALPPSAASEDANKLAIVSFCLGGLNLLGSLEPSAVEAEQLLEEYYMETDDYAAFRATSYFQHAGNYDLPSLSATMFGLIALVQLGYDVSRLNTPKIRRFLQRCQRESGAFAPTLVNGQPFGESDLRSCYIVAVIREILERWERNEKSKNGKKGNEKSKNGLQKGSNELKQNKDELLKKGLFKDELLKKGSSLDEPLKQNDSSFDEPLKQNDSSFDEPLKSNDSSFDEPLKSNDSFFDEPLKQNDSSGSSNDEPYSVPSDINVISLKHFVLSCIQYNGAFSSGPDEGHLGLTFCGLACLKLLGHEFGPQFDKTRDWLIHRHVSYESSLYRGQSYVDYDPADTGGFNGRENKLADTCYSWWCTASLSILGSLQWVDTEKAKSFLFEQTQNTIVGGFAKDSEQRPDPMHSYLALASLGLWGEKDVERVDDAMVFMI